MLCSYNFNRLVLGFFFSLVPHQTRTGVILMSAALVEKHVGKSLVPTKKMPRKVSKPLYSLGVKSNLSMLFCGYSGEAEGNSFGS